MASPGLVLVINAGSSSLKFAVFRDLGSGDPEPAVEGQVNGIGSRPRLTARDPLGAPLVERDLPPGSVTRCEEAIPIAGELLRECFRDEPVAAVGHRLVHGGPRLVKPTLLDAAVLAELETLVPLAPLHLPSSLACVRAIRRWRSDVPQVLCFDTAYHRSHDKVADVYALPLELYERGIRRYGFHGISYEYIASALPFVAPGIAGGRVVVAHLGNGASLCAMRAGRCIDSTMGFSTLGGLVMGTRPGELDPGVVLYLLSSLGMTAGQVEHLLYHDAGLKGLSGLTHDVRSLLASDDPRARFALDCFVYRAAKEIGAMAGALGGIDAIVFTAGMGEISPEIRARVVEACGWLGASLDPAANAAKADHARRISPEGCPVSVWIVPTREDFMIARQTVRAIRGRETVEREARSRS